MRLIKKGATSQSVYFTVTSTATGGKLTALAYNTSGLTAYYCRNGSTSTSITLATQTASGAYSSGGFVEIDSSTMKGLYRLDVPNAAFASGVDSVVITIQGAANMAQADTEIQLIGFDIQQVTLNYTGWSGPSATLADDTSALNSTTSSILSNGFNPNAQLTETYAANGTVPTTAQALLAIHQCLMDASIVTTSKTVHKLNHTDTAFVITHDSATAPTSASRT